MIEEFWVTTVSGGTYHVYLDNGKPIAEKVSQQSISGEIDPDSDLVEVSCHLKGGTHLAITKCSGIAMYIPEHSAGKRCTAWATNIGYWGGHSSPIVGLFDNPKSAVAAYTHTPETLPWDWRSISQTMAILAQIPEDHKQFVIDEPVRDMLSAVAEICK